MMLIDFNRILKDAMMETVIRSKTKRNISKFIVVTLQINY